MHLLLLFSQTSFCSRSDPGTAREGEEPDLIRVDELQLQLLPYYRAQHSRSDNDHMITDFLQRSCLSETPVSIHLREEC